MRAWTQQRRQRPPRSPSTPIPAALLRRRRHRRRGDRRRPARPARRSPPPARNSTSASLLGHLVGVLPRVAAMGRGIDPMSVGPRARRLGRRRLARAWRAAAADADSGVARRRRARAHDRVAVGDRHRRRALLGYASEITVHTWDVAARDRSDGRSGTTEAVGPRAPLMRSWLPGEARAEIFAAGAHEDGPRPRRHSPTRSAKSFPFPTTRRSSTSSSRGTAAGPKPVGRRVLAHARPSLDPMRRPRRERPLLRRGARAARRQARHGFRRGHRLRHRPQPTFWIGATTPTRSRTASHTSRSPRPIAPRCARSSRPRSRRAPRCCTSRASGPSTTRTTTAGSCATPTATTSRPSATYPIGRAP